MHTFPCTRCDGTGFLNLEQVDDATLVRFDLTGDHQVILDWIDEMDSKRRGDGCTCAINPQFVPCSYCEYRHDVQVCDCCDGSGNHDWDNPDDSKGCR